MYKYKWPLYTDHILAIYMYKDKIFVQSNFDSSIEHIEAWVRMGDENRINWKSHSYDSLRILFHQKSEISCSCLAKNLFFVNSHFVILNHGLPL